MSGRQPLHFIPRRGTRWMDEIEEYGESGPLIKKED